MSDDNKNEKNTPPAPKGRGGAPVKTSAPKDETGENLNNTGQKRSKQVDKPNNAASTKEALAVEPKVSYMIPLGFGEKRGAEETVTINGHRFVIKKGVRVEVPKSVALMLDQYLNIQEEVGLDIRADRDDKDVEDALS